MEDLVENITRGNPGSVKAVLASVVLALATYQLILAAIGYRRLPVIDAAPAFLTHRASGDAIVVLFVLVALGRGSASVAELWRACRCWTPRCRSREPWPFALLASAGFADPHEAPRTWAAPVRLVLGTKG